VRREVRRRLRGPAQQVIAVGGLAGRVPLAHDDPRRESQQHELADQRRVVGSERVDRVVAGDHVERRDQRVGAGGDAELVAGGDAHVHRNRAGQAVAEVQHAGYPVRGCQQVVAVKVGVDDLAARRRVREARQHPRLEPVQAADQGRALVPVRQLAGQLVKQRAELMEVLQVPQVGAVRARVRERAQRLVKPGERAADVAAQRGAGRPRAEDRPLQVGRHPDDVAVKVQLWAAVESADDPLDGQRGCGPDEV
jgi:hypothetical protein